MFRLENTFSPRATATIRAAIISQKNAFPYIVVGFISLGFAILFSALTSAVLGYMQPGAQNVPMFLVFVFLFFLLVFVAGVVMVTVVRRFGGKAPAIV